MFLATWCSFSSRTTTSSTSFSSYGITLSKNLLVLKSINGLFPCTNCDHNRFRPSLQQKFIRGRGSSRPYRPFPSFPFPSLPSSSPLFPRLKVAPHTQLGIPWSALSFSSGKRTTFSTRSLSFKYIANTYLVYLKPRKRVWQLQIFVLFLLNEI